MATGKAISIPAEHSGLLDVDRHDVLGLTLSIALPISVLVVANGFAQISGVVPVFFVPFGLPAWVGAAALAGGLALFGVARWIVADRGSRGVTAGWWIVALMAGVIAFPFLVASLDSIMLGLVSMVILLVGIAASLRTAEVSRRAGWLMAPGLVWLGLSAMVGLSLAAAWTPPFAVANANATTV